MLDYIKLNLGEAILFKLVRSHNTCIISQFFHSFVVSSDKLLLITIIATHYNTHYLGNRIILFFMLIVPRKIHVSFEQVVSME